MSAKVDFRSVTYCLGSGPARHLAEAAGNHGPFIYVSPGRWNGQQIISQRWVAESTTPDPSDRRSWKDSIAFQQAGGYYKYHWWGLNNPDGTYDYLARGKQGQYVYISPSTNTLVVRLGGGTKYDPWPFAIRALIHSLL